MITKLERWINGALLASSMVVALSSCEPDDPVPPVVKTTSQSLNVKDDVSLQYAATLNNVNTAVLKVSRDGQLIFTEDISDVAQNGPDFQVTYSYKKDDSKLKNITRGKYTFELTAGDIIKTANAEIVDFPTFIDDINWDVVENVPSKKSTSALKDKNLEQMPITLTGVKSVDGKTKVTYTTTATGYDFNVTAVSGSSGSYQLELDFKNGEGKLDDIVLGGQITKDNRINYLVVPNDSTKNYYGSADANNDNILNSQDLTRLIEVANGTYSDSNDKRLRDRCDLNGDTYVNLSDVQILQDKLNGVIAYLPGDWNNSTIEQQKDWAKKMFAIDKTNEIVPFSGWDCNQFTDQTYINVHGVSPKDISKFQQVYNYDFTNNGRFNLPLLEVITIENDADGKLIYAHALNAFMFANPSIYGNICPFEPQKDHLNVQFGEDFLIGTNSKFYVRGPPVLGVVTHQDGTKDISMQWYVKYDVKDKIPTMTWIYSNLVTK